MPTRVVSFAVLLVASCGPLPGDRSGGGGCPIGETCSPQAPTGLFFEGQTLSSHIFDVGDHPTAVGGQQIYRIYRNEEREPISVPFSTEIQGAGEVVSTTGTTVTVSATSAGTFQLRVLDLDGALLDSISLPAAEIDRAEILPTAGARFAGPLDNNEPPLYFVDETMALVLGLRDGSNRALVDNQATASMGSRDEWDLYREVVATDSTIDVVAGGSDFAAVIETVSSVDDLSVTNSVDGRIEVAPNGIVQPCFAAHAGTRIVYGAPWTFSVAGGGLALGRIHLDRCIDVESSDSGVGTLTVSGGDRQEDFTIETVDSSRRAAPSPVVDQWRPMRGDRAAFYDIGVAAQ